MGREERFVALRLQPATRAETEGNFFIFFFRNPLKRLDSEKEIKANESSFAFFYFHLLAIYLDEFRVWVAFWTSRGPIARTHSTAFPIILPLAAT
jgi:hypothetical protein